MTAMLFGELTADGQSIVLVAEGEPYELGYVAKMLETVTAHATVSDPPGALVMPLSWPAVVQLAGTFGRYWQPQPRLYEWIAAEVDRRMGDLTKPLAYTPPNGLEPYPWQIVGANMFASIGRILIDDSPRTGKTPLTVLGLMERDFGRSETFTEWMADPVFPAIVICPASVIDDAWLRAFADWAPALDVVAWRGPKRTQILDQDVLPDVYVMSYEVATRDVNTHLPKMRARTLVLDEVHYIANKAAARTKACMKLGRSTDNFIGLSGTPIKVHAGERWPTLATMDYHAWPSNERFGDRYLAIATGDYGEMVLGLRPHAEPEFRMCLLGQERRVSLTDVMPHLPRKLYSVRTVEMPKAWRKAYDEFAADMIAELPDNADELKTFDVRTKHGHLSRLAAAAADVDVEPIREISSDPGALCTCGLEVWPDVPHDPHADDCAIWVKRNSYHLNLRAPSWKIDELLNILAERPGEQMIVYGGPWEQLATLAWQSLPPYIKGERLIGGMTPTVRQDVIDRFQAGQIDVLCATTGAGGTGLTLTAGGIIVFLARPWSLVESIQAEDRSSGIGSEGRAYTDVIDIVAADTVDTRTRDLLKGKASQLSELVRDPRIVRELFGGKP